jgi:Derlin-2/3
MMLVSFLMAGPGSLVMMLIGLFAAHLHDFLTRTWPEFGGGRNWIPTPAFLSRLVAAGERMEFRGYGTAIRPAGSNTGNGGSGGSGPLPDSWRTKGRGQRLGGT